MRYSVLVLLLVGGLLSGAPSPLHAQEGRQFGVTLGTNWTTMQSPSPDLDRYFVFVGGVGLKQPLPGPVALQSELLLSQKGAEIRGDEGASIEFRAGYLELPILMHLKAPSFKSITVYGEAGGYGGVKLFERQTPGDNVSLSFDTGVSFFHRLNAGILAGIGTKVQIRGQTLNLTVRHDWGVPDVARDVDEQPFEDVTFPAEGRTRTWSVLLRLGR